MVIRDVRPEEHAAVGELVAGVYQALIPDLDEYADELRAVDRRLAAGVRVWVADVDGALGGTISYVPGPGPYAEFDDPRGAGIRMLAVLPAFQGRGIGEALVRACLDRARADGRSRVYLSTTEWMEAAQRLYLRIGFRRAPELDWEPQPGFTLTSFVFDVESPSAQRLSP